MLLLMVPTQAVAKSLTGTEIQNELSGHSFDFKQQGVTGTVWFNRNGTVKYKIKKGNANVPSGFADNGVWFIKGNRYCSNYKQRGLQCSRIKRTADGKLRSSRGNVLTKR